MKFYPPGPITPYGAKLLMELIEPLILYTTADGTIQWAINGGLAPWPGIQEGATLVDGVSGLHPPFSFVEHKGARQPGSTVQATVYDPAEYDMQIELMAAPNNDNPAVAAAAIRRVVREWVSSWDPANPGTLKWITPDMGQWTCTPRLYRSPPDRQFKAQARRLRQRYTWTIRNDDAFWRGVDSMSDFRFEFKKGFDTFNRSDSNTLGPQWVQTYETANTSKQLSPITRSLSLLGGTPTITVTHTGAQIVIPQTRVLTLTGTAPGLPGISQKVVPVPRVLTLTGGVPGIQKISTATFANGIFGTTSPGGNTALGRAQWFPSGVGTNGVNNRLLGINELQTVSINGSFTGGSWTYVVNGQTATVPNNATPAQFQTAIENLSNVAPGDVSVTGATNGPYTVTFLNNLGFQNITTSASGVGLTPGGTATSAVVATQVDGTGGTTSTDNQIVTVKLGEFFGFGLPENGWFDIWGRRDSNDFAPTGIRIRIGGGIGALAATITISRFNAGVETVMFSRLLIIAPLWWEEWRVSFGTTANPRRYRVERDNFLIVDYSEPTAGSALGAAYRGVGFGAKAAAGYFNQGVPPGIDQFWFGDNGTITQSGHVQLTNFGDQDAYPRYLVYGPGTFRIADGPGSTNMIEFGPLSDNQIALLTTLPRLRSVVDLSPDQPEQPLTSFQGFVKTLISLAVNSNLPPLLEWFESLLGITPPQGELYSLLNGRFTRPVPRKPDGEPPTTQSIAVEIVNGTADSKIIAALTPLRRWPE